MKAKWLMLTGENDELIFIETASICTFVKISHPNKVEYTSVVLNNGNTYVVKHDIIEIRDLVIGRQDDLYN